MSQAQFNVIEAGANLLEQSLWWLLPFILLTLLMLHAMMEFTVTLLMQPPQPNRKPIAVDKLRQRLLAVVNQADQDYQLVVGQACDLEICWEMDKAPPAGRWALTKAASRGCLRLLLDEPRHEVRMNQVTSSYYFFLGLSGWLPRLSGYAGAASGPPGHPMARELGLIANRVGWTVRPVLWWFQATYRGYDVLEALKPKPLRRWPASRFWGILYPLTYLLAMAYLVLVVGSFERQDWYLLVGISLVWWGMWGFLVWMLRGFPAFWRH